MRMSTRDDVIVVSPADWAVDLIRSLEMVCGQPTVPCWMEPVPGSRHEWTVTAAVGEAEPILMLQTVGPRPELAAAVAAVERARRVHWASPSVRRGWSAYLLAEGVRIRDVWDVDVVGRVLADEAAGDAAKAGDAAAIVAATAATVRRQRAALADSRAAHPGWWTLGWVDSACQLLAAEMSVCGVPCDRDRLNSMLEEVLGATASGGTVPTRVAQAEAALQAACHGARFNWRSRHDAIEALADEGVVIRSTSIDALRSTRHPMAEALADYQAAVALWDWAQQVEVRDGRHVGEWQPLTARSGRGSASNGLLTIPKQLLGAYVADPSWVFVCGDFAQLEPRVLAVLSGDEAMLGACAKGDIYADVARVLGLSSREAAKVALNAALYGSVNPLVGKLRAQFPHALRYQMLNEQTGRAGGAVRTALGRRSEVDAELVAALAAGGSLTPAERAARWRRALKMGRHTRNFPIQGSGAELANTAAVIARRQLMADDLGAEIVMLRHDDVVVHCRAESATAVARTLEAAARSAVELVFAGREGMFPLRIRSGQSLAEL